MEKDRYISLAFQKWNRAQQKYIDVESSIKTEDLTTPDGVSFEGLKITYQDSKIQLERETDRPNSKNACIRLAFRDDAQPREFIAGKNILLDPQDLPTPDFSNEKEKALFESAMSKEDKTIKYFIEINQEFAGVTNPLTAMEIYSEKPTETLHPDKLIISVIQPTIGEGTGSLN